MTKFTTKQVHIGEQSTQKNKHYLFIKIDSSQFKKMF